MDPSTLVAPRNSPTNNSNSSKPATPTPTNYWKQKKRNVGYWIGWVGVVSLLLLQVKKFVEINHPENNNEDTPQVVFRATRTSASDAAMKKMLQERRRKNINNTIITVPTETLQKLKEAALLELDIGNNNNKKNNNKVSSLDFEWPIIPTSGYRRCLNHTLFPHYIQKRFKNTSSSLVSYMGVINNNNTTNSICHHDNNISRCVELREKDHSFEELSELVCQSQLLICGINASMICGMLGLSTRTYIQVATETLETWPEYLWEDQYDYETHTMPTLAKNHRLFWDRHTIPSNHPIMRFKYEQDNQTAFNVYFYAEKKLCPPETSPERHNHIVKKGNMGDIYATHLANYFIQKRGGHKMDFFTACGGGANRSKWPHDVTMSIVGSWAEPAMRQNHSILLGVGTISDKLEKLPLFHDPRNYVMGVRGPFTRDSFLLRYGWNPSISADPGLYANQVFQKDIEKQKAATTKTKIKRRLCFISHEVDTVWFFVNMKKFRRDTRSAGGTSNIHDIIRFMAQCQHIASSSLHGVIFAHSLSIPAMPIKVSPKLAGGEWKFYDYYHGINVTDFIGRYPVRPQVAKKMTENQWIDMVRKFPQPPFPFDENALHVFEDFQKIFPHPHGD